LELFKQATSWEHLEEIERRDMLAFVKLMADRGNSRRTQANRVNYVKCFFNRFGLKTPLLKTDKIKYTQKAVTAYSAEELKCLFAVATSEELELFQLFLCTSARDGEVHARRESLHDGLGYPGDDGEVGACGDLRDAPVASQCLTASRLNTEGSREPRLGHMQVLPDAFDVDRIGNMDLKALALTGEIGFDLVEAAHEFAECAGHDSPPGLPPVGVEDGVGAFLELVAFPFGLLSFPFYQVHYGNPVGYLGYLFNLKFMATRNGVLYMDMLANCGIPRNAMSFIAEHATVDLAHNKLMEQYIEELVVTESDIDSIPYAAKFTSNLYSKMLQAAYDSVQIPKDWGLDPREQQMMRPSATISQFHHSVKQRVQFSKSKAL
jgi:hypothetical protein